VVVRGEVIDSPHPVKYGKTFNLAVQLLYTDDSIYRTDTYLKVYLSIQSDSSLPEAGEIWQLPGKLVPFSNNGNPGELDFKSVMCRKNCWYRFYVYNGQESARFTREIHDTYRTLTSALIRKRVSDHWHGGMEEVSLLKAVCLGDRSSLTDDIRQAYAIAGGMHLLAVSGLHVGLIWWVLQYLTRWLYSLFRNEIPRTLTVLGLLWFYAFVTGFSASVCRSVTMFSFFSISRMMGKRTHPVNGILVSAFLLVLIEPQRLMEVGFQLSYAAILGLVALYPLNRKLLRIKNRVLRRIWEAVFISLSAQFTTAPLVCFYFHKLPVYSLITSLVTVPILSGLIAIFVCSVPFVSAGIMEDFFNFLLINLAHMINRCVEFISSMPAALIDDLHLDKETCCIWLLVILMLMIAVHSRSRIPRYMMLLLISIYLSRVSISGLNRYGSSELVISHFNGASMIIIRQGSEVDQYCWYRDTASREYMKAYSELCWNRRVYEKHLFEVGESLLVQGNISSCIKLCDGFWCLGNGQTCGLVINSSLKGSLWEILTGESGIPLYVRPGFILLSGEPAEFCQHEKSWMKQTDLVVDGSNRKWFREIIRAGWDRIYLTDESGAYMKRW
jgi:competence protein ComEC